MGASEEIPLGRPTMGQCPSTETGGSTLVGAVISPPQVEAEVTSFPLVLEGRED